MFEAFLRSGKTWFKLQIKCGYCKERVVVERLAFKDYKLQNFIWLREPEYIPRKVTAGIKYIGHENVVEFVQKRDPLCVLKV